MHQFESQQSQTEESSRWCEWCRLCAKKNLESKVNILFNNLDYSTSEEPNLTLREALEKYFWVQTSSNDLLPNVLCSACASLLSSIINFNERVERVQQMYNFLIESGNGDDLSTIRSKFDVSDHDRKQWFPSFLIKQEYLDSTQVRSFNCVEEIRESITQGEEINDAKTIINEKDPFDIIADNNENNLNNYTSEEDNKSDENYAIHKRKNIVETTKNSKKKRRTNFYRHKSKSQDFPLNSVCKVCGDNFNLFSTYCEHMKKHIKDDNKHKLLKCPSCDKVLQSLYNFERHMRMHIPMEDRRKINCPDCNNQYTSNAQLGTHIRVKHKNEKNFVCEECGLSLRTNSNLKQHMLTHTDITPFECEICKKRFKNNSRLKIHMDIHSPNKHVCAICGLQLNSRATLNRHFLVHSDEINHKCDYCGRAFKRAKALKNHLILHTGLKPYCCNFCDRTFANGSNCRSHMKKMHPTELASLEASGNKTYAKNIPKLETLKAVTKAADNLTPVVTKFSGCFAFGKKPKSSTASDKHKALKTEQKSKKITVSETLDNSTSPSDLQTSSQIGKNCIYSVPNISSNVADTSSTTLIPNFDNIYQHLIMKQSPNEMHIKRHSPLSSPILKNTSLDCIPHSDFYNHIPQASIIESSQPNADLKTNPEGKLQLT